MQTCLASVLAHTGEVSKYAMALDPALSNRASTLKCCVWRDLDTTALPACLWLVAAACQLQLLFRGHALGRNNPA